MTAKPRPVLRCVSNTALEPRANHPKPLLKYSRSFPTIALSSSPSAAAAAPPSSSKGRGIAFPNASNRAFPPMAPWLEGQENQEEQQPQEQEVPDRRELLADFDDPSPAPCLVLPGSSSSSSSLSRPAVLQDCSSASSAFSDEIEDMLVLKRANPVYESDNDEGYEFHSPNKRLRRTKAFDEDDQVRDDVEDSQNQSLSLSQQQQQTELIWSGSVHETEGGFIISIDA